MKWKVKIVFALVIIGVAQYLQAESIHGPVTGFVDDESGPLPFRLEEIVVIKSQDYPDYQEGIELQIDLSEGLQHYSHSFAVMVYKNITPVPDTGIQSYHGTRIFMHLISNTPSMYLRIPFIKNHTISGDALTHILPSAVAQDEFPLLVTILPVAKGVPDIVYVQEFAIRLSDIWKDVGSVAISVSNPSGASDEIIAATVDGNAVALDEVLVLSTGVHKVMVNSTHAPAIEQAIAIERGKHISLPVTLDYSPPTITISTLEGTRVILDDEELEIESGITTLEIEPGEHKITGVLGEHETSKNFSIHQGGRVSIELIFDIKITEHGIGNLYGVGVR